MSLSVLFWTCVIGISALALLTIIWLVHLFWTDRAANGWDGDGDAPRARPFRGSPRHAPRHAQTVALPCTAAAAPVAATADRPPWESDTMVDASLHEAIKAMIDGCPSTHQLVDRYFSQVDLRKIFADAGLPYVPTGGAS
jgi:hypothetical protein